MQTIIFRVDSGRHIGSGHVYRCLSIADSLKKNFNIVFVCRDFINNANNEIKRCGFEVSSLNCDNSSSEDILPENYSTWLGVSSKQDAEDTIDAINNIRKPISWLVVDHYALNCDWETVISKYVSNIFVIDNLANRKHCAAALLDFSPGFDHKKRYQSLVPKACKTFFGVDYLQIGENFFGQKKEPVAAVKKILIFLGSMDFYDDVSKVVESCLKVKDICFAILPGKHTDLVSLNKKIKGLDNFQIMNKVTDMSTLYAKADLCIGTNGVSGFERGVMAMPTINLVVANNQERSAEFLESEGLVINLKDQFREDGMAIANILNKIKLDISLVNKIQKNCLSFYPDYKYNFLSFFTNY